MKFEHTYILELSSENEKACPFQTSTVTCLTVLHDYLEQEAALNLSEYLSHVT